MASSQPRVAIITGAARGIGRAISLRLAQDGLNIVASDLPARATELESLTKEINARKDGQNKAISAYADVTSEEEVNALVGAAVKEFGGVDVMVANAGICPVNELVAISLEEWESVFAVNVRGVFLCYRAAAAQMIKQGRGGRIIGASSFGGKRGTRYVAAYSSTKFAVRGLTQAAADDLAKHKITVNAYAPGHIPTELSKKIYLDLAQISEGMTTNAKLPDIPIGEPEDVAGLVSYLVREESKFITGQSISINGGVFYD